ncbi:MAG: cytochrome P450 [Halobacteriovoraceae bacterium]|nr:cytochrome P450 [Halobacteriovoraceae bacterium]
MKTDNIENRIQADGVGFHEFKRNSNVLTFHDDFAKYVKSFGDVFYWPKGNFHVVTNALLAKKALTNPLISCNRSSFFISRMPNMDLSLLSDFFGVVSKMTVMSDGDAHNKRRSIATFGLNDELIDNYSKQIPIIIKKLILDAVSDGKIDFAKDISSRLPSIILADLFSIPQEDRDKFYEWSGIMTGFFGGGTGYENSDGIKVNSAAKELKNYFENLLKARKENLGSDFFSGMLRVAAKHDLDDDELISQAIMMLVAGQVTTTDQMNNIMLQLLQSQKTFSEVKEDNNLIPNMIEELKRLDPAVTFIFRVAKDDTYIGNQKIHKGETVFISTHTINRDPSLFKNPNNIDINRKNMNHYSYGYGAHYCMGAKLARIEMNILFTILINEYPHMKLSAERVERNHYSLSFSGFNSLPIVLS